MTRAAKRLNMEQPTLSRQMKLLEEELGEGIHGVISIGSVVSCFTLLPSWIDRFHELYPRVTYKIYEGDLSAGGAAQTFY